MNRFSEYIKKTVSLSGHLDLKTAESTIRKNVEYGGPNVFILACAIIIASVGLNVNSIPVIIGAMLISPVMGPIIGFGFGLGTNDTDLVASALKNFMVMVTISIASSALYFLISPLNMSNPTELMSRTNPTIYDVLIALFGGIAGMFEMSRKERGTVLSGVAIATALMPPLCTVGYGIATLNWAYFRGALYLFIINTVFISLAVFITTKYLGFKSLEAENEDVKRRRSRVVWVIVTLLMVPSVISAVKVVRENNFMISAERFISENKSMGSSYIYDYAINGSEKPYSVTIYLAGEKLEPQSVEILMKSAESHGLTRSQVIIRDEATNRGIDSQEIFKDLYEYYDRRIEDLNKTIFDLETELSRYRQKDSLAAVSQSDSVWVN